MNELIKKGKKLFTAGVVLTTIVWSAGFGAFLPLTASAQNLQPGTLIKGSLPSVYYYSQDGKRYVFPNEKTFFTWYSDFSSVVTVTDSQLAALPIGGNVTYKPGVKMVKITTDPKVYAVDAMGTLRWVQTEAAAMALYGNNWNQMIDDVPDAFFVNYNSNGAPIASAADFNPASVQSSITSIDQNMGVAVGVAQLTVTRASDTPASKTVPKQSTNVKYLTFTLTAGSQAVNVNGFTFKRGGVGAPNNFDRVYVFEGNNRLVDGRSVNSSTHEVTFSGMGLTIPANQSRTLTLVADHANVTNDVNNFFTLQSVDTNAPVQGLPISGNSMTVSAAVSVGTLTVDKAGTVSNPEVGQVGAVIARFSLEASSVEDVMVYRVALKMDGSISEDRFRNFELYRGANMLATVGQVNSQDLIIFNLSTPLLIKEGEKVNFDVRADALGQRAGDTGNVYVKNKADVYAVGQNYGAGVQVNIAGYDGAGNNKSDFVLQGGDLTFSFVGPNARDIAVKGDDVTFLQLNVTASRRATIKSFPITVSAGAASAEGGLIDTNANPDVANLTDIKVRFNGQVLMGPDELSVGGNDTNQTITFTDDVVLEPGVTYSIVVSADVRDNLNLAGEVYYMTLVMGNLVAEDDNGDAIGTVPAASIQGKNHSVVAASVALSLSSTPLTDTAIKGQQGVEIAGFNFKASDTSDITITRLNLTGYVDENSNGTWAQRIQNGLDIRDVVASVSIYDRNTNTLIAGPKSFGAGTGVVQFDNFIWTIPQGATRTLLVKANLANKAVENGDADNIAVDIIATADVTAEDKDGRTVTPSFDLAFPNSDNGSGGARDAIDTVGNEPNVFVTIEDNGALTAVIDPSSPDPEVIVAGTSQVPVYAVRFSADNEAFEVKKLRLDNAGSNALLTAVHASYKDANGTTRLVPGTVTGTMVTFSGLDFYVPKNSRATITFLATINNIPPATSGTNITLNFHETADFEAIGVSSGEQVTTIPGGNVVVAGSAQTVYNTKPTITLASDSPGGPAAAPGYGQVLKFVVKADARDDVEVRGFCFSILSTDYASTDWNQGANLTAAKFDLFTNDNIGTPKDIDADWTRDSATDCSTGTVAGGEVVKSVLLDLGATRAITVPRPISPNQAQTIFNLYMDVTGANGQQDDSIRVDILDILWRDQKVNANITGAPVKNIPLYGKTIVY